MRGLAGVLLAAALYVGAQAQAVGPGQVVALDPADPAALGPLGKAPA
jgi:hypothetical protein